MITGHNSHTGVYLRNLKTKLRKLLIKMERISIDCLQIVITPSAHPQSKHCVARYLQVDCLRLVLGNIKNSLI